MTDIANPFFAQTVKAVVAIAPGIDYEVIVADTSNDVAAERRAVSVFAAKRVDGLIIVPATSHDVDHLRPSAGILRPVVLLDRRLSDHPGTSVTSDDFQAAKDVVALLAAKGHERIGMIDGNSTRSGFAGGGHAEIVSDPALDRIEGFRAGMRASGFQLAPDSMLFAQASDRAGLHAAAAALLTAEEHPRPLSPTTATSRSRSSPSAAEPGWLWGQDVSLVMFDPRSGLKCSTRRSRPSCGRSPGWARLPCARSWRRSGACRRRTESCCRTRLSTAGRLPTGC